MDIDPIFMTGMTPAQRAFIEAFVERLERDRRMGRTALDTARDIVVARGWTR
jgi:hypothetical protein